MKSTEIVLDAGDVRNFEIGNLIRFERRPVWWKPWTWRFLFERWRYVKMEVVTVDRLNGVLTINEPHESGASLRAKDHLG